MVLILWAVGSLSVAAETEVGFRRGARGRISSRADDLRETSKAYFVMEVKRSDRGEDRQLYHCPPVLALDVQKFQ